MEPELRWKKMQHWLLLSRVKEACRQWEVPMGPPVSEEKEQQKQQVTKVQIRNVGQERL